jgi:hypothetical protein
VAGEAEGGGAEEEFAIGGVGIAGFRGEEIGSKTGLDEVEGIVDFLGWSALALEVEKDFKGGGRGVALKVVIGVSHALSVELRTSA